MKKKIVIASAVVLAGLWLLFALSIGDEEDTR